MKDVSILYYFVFNEQHWLIYTRHGCNWVKTKSKPKQLMCFSLDKMVLNSRSLLGCKWNQINLVEHAKGNYHHAAPGCFDLVRQALVRKIHANKLWPNEIDSDGTIPIVFYRRDTMCRPSLDSIWNERFKSEYTIDSVWTGNQATDAF